MSGSRSRGGWWTLPAPYAIGILMTAIVFGASFPVQERIVHRVIENRLAAARVDLDAEVTTVSERLHDVEQLVGRLRRGYYQTFEIGTAQLDAEFARRTVDGPTGTRHNAPGFDYRRSAGIWSPGVSTTNDTLRAVYAAGARSLEAAVAAIDEEMPRIWVLPRDGGEATFAPFDSAYFVRGSGSGYLGTEWVERTRPGQRRRERPQWLEPYSLRQGADHVIPVVLPIDIHGTWWGTIGADVAGSGLIASLRTLAESGSGFALYSELGASVFAPRDAERLGGPSLTRGELNRLQLAASSGQRHVESGDHMLISTMVPGPNWTAVLSFSRGDLERRISRPMQAVRAALGLLIVMTLLFGWRAGRRELDRRVALDLEVRKTGERFEKLFQFLPDALALSGQSTGGLAEINDGFCRLTGHRREEVIGRSDVELGLWADLAERRRIHEAISSTGSIVNATARFRRKDGSVRDCLYSGRMVEIDDTVFLLSIVRDVTDERRLEQQFAHAQKMEAVGRLAGGVAHDFNNIITAISGHASMVQDRFAPDDPAFQDMAEIIRSSERAADLTRQLLGFARRQIVQPRVVDLVDQIREMERFLGRLLGEDIALTVTSHGEPASVRIDPGQFEQVLANLVVNARDAMPHGGRVAIDVDRVGGRVSLRVRDTGTGIPDPVKAHIFEPFFTTKGPGKGTGLGLSTCYGIIRQAGGDIEVASEVGQGSTFQLWLPAVDPSLESAVEAKSEVVAVPQRGRGETILLVEDEPLVRSIIRRTLAAAGYRILEAESGDDAIERFETRLAEIDLVVTDVVMPGISGIDLLARFRRARPELAVLFVSGYSEERLELSGAVTDHTQFLAKPFRADELVRRVNLQLRSLGSRA